MIPAAEPFRRLFNQGVITKDGHKMSKSRGNVVNPGQWVERLGADTVRLYLMFLGPWDHGGDWDDSGIQGLHRWLNRVWTLALRPPARVEAAASAVRLRHFTHRMIKKVTEDLESFRFNTMLAAMMEYSNAFRREGEAGAVDGAAWDEGIESLLLCLAPSAPHIAEELWQRMGRDYSVHQQPWPTWEAALVAEETVTLVVQVNGKVRAQLPAAPGLDEPAARSLAESHERVARHLANKTVRKVVYVPDRLINFVAG